ncbi:MAG: hypothetical protein QM669_07445 [Siphonobacter sp.]
MNPFFAKSLLTGLCIVLCLKVSFAQPVVSNIRTEVSAERVKVIYDIQNLMAQDSVYLQVEGRSKGLYKVITVTGDVGKEIAVGTDRVMYWDYVLDGVKIGDEQIRAIIQVKPGPRPQKIGGGPANALLSVLVPGLGNIMVQPNHRIGLRPLITVAYGGLLAYGFIQKGKSNKEYNIYKAEQYNAAKVESNYTEANRLYHNYAWAVRAAAAVMVSDVVYTLLKGTKNARLKRSAQQHISLNYLGKTPIVAYHITF